LSEEQLRNTLRESDIRRTARSQRARDLASLLKSIHRDPPLRSWVTLESRPLLPFVERLDPSASPGEVAALVHVLLTAPSDGHIQAPWAYVAWRWPQAQVVAMIDIRDKLDMRGLVLTEVALATDAVLVEIEAALNAGKALPTLLPTLSDIYKRVLAIPLGVRDRALSKAVGAPVVAPLRSVEPPPEPTPEKAVMIAHSPSVVAEAMTKTRALLDTCEQASLMKEWQRIRLRMNAPQFSVVVAGEFSRGKTTLINQLLERELLPVGDLPTTAMIAQITYKSEPEAERLFSNGTRERVAFSELLHMKANEDDVDPDALLLLKLDNEWLRSNGIQILDTPGVGDAFGKRAELAIEAISNADATVVAISATMPMSLTERTFIDQHVLSRSVPRIAVVLTRLDQVKVADRGQVIAHVRAKLAEWAPAAELWTSCGDDIAPRDAAVDAMGPAAIRARLTQWAQSPEHRGLRVGQVASQLSALHGDLRGVLEERSAVLALGVEDIEKARAAAHQAMDREQLAWEDLRLEMETRQIAAGRWITDRLMRTTSTVTETLGYQLQRAPQPADWWKRDFPFLFRRELLSLGRGIEAELQKRIAADAGWLVENVQAQLAWGIELARPDALIDGPIAEFIGSPELEDLSKKKTLTLVTVGVTSVAALALFGPLGLVVPLGAKFLTERMMDASVKEQKRVLLLELEKNVADTLGVVAQNIRQRLQTTYEKMLQETKAQEAMWHEARKNTVDALGADADPSSLLATVVEQVAALDSIEAGLGMRKRTET